VVDAILQLTGFGQVVDKDQLARLILQRLSRELDPATIAQGDLVPSSSRGSKQRVMT